MENLCRVRQLLLSIRKVMWSFCSSRKRKNVSSRTQNVSLRTWAAKLRTVLLHVRTLLLDLRTLLDQRNVSIANQVHTLVITHGQTPCRPSYALQGYLAHQKVSPTLGPPKGPTHKPTVISQGEAFPSERGTPLHWYIYRGTSLITQPPRTLP